MRNLFSLIGAAAVALTISAASAHDPAPEDPSGLPVPAADMAVVTPPEEMTEAIRAFFPEAYSQFMTVAYERQDGGEGRQPEIWPKSASFLVPASAYAKTVEPEIDERVTDLVVRVLRPGDAHCEGFEVGDVEEYGWMHWPEKTVRKITVHFGVAC